MSSRSRRSRSRWLAGLLALTLSFVAGVPGLTTGPGSSTPVVAQANGVSYVRVSSLKRPTQATSIAMPRLGIPMPIRKGVIGDPISARYAYHYPTTSWPGGKSNTYPYAHAQPSAFLST